MKFCRNCGEELTEGIKFCKECGHTVEETDQNQTTTEASPTKNQTEVKSAQPEQPKKQSAPMSKKTKIILSVVGALIVLLFAGFKIGESLTSYEKVVDKFEEALIEKDEKKIANMLVAETKNLSIDKDSVKGFIDYYQDNPSEMNNLITHLRQQGSDYKNNPEFAGNSDEYNIVNLVKKGKKIIYDNFEIRVKPVYFNVHTNYKDTDLTINGEKIGTADSEDYSKEFGPYLPGTYTFGAVYQSDFVELETEDVYSNVSPDYASDVSLYIEGEEVYFEVPNAEGFESIKLFINGEDANINLLEQDEIGPVLTDGSMEVSFEAEFPWGTVKSDSRPIDDYYMAVSFTADDELKETIQDVIVKYNQEYIEAITTAKADKFTVAEQDLVDYIIDDVEYRKEYDYFYKGKFIGIDFDNESFDFYYDSYEDKWSVEVETVTIFDQHKYYSTYNEPELEVEEDEMAYEVSYDAKNETWLISDTGYGYVEGNDMIEHREKEPKTYTSEWEKLKD